VHRRRLQLESLEERALLAGYTVVDLGTLGGYADNPMFINDSGQIAASGAVGNNGHAMLYSNGAWTDLRTLGGDNSVPFGINNAGEVVGTSDVPLVQYSCASGAFVYSNGGMSDISPDNGKAGKDCCGAYGINNAGVIVGQTVFKVGDSVASHAASYSHGTWSNLGTLGGGKNDSSFANSINDAGAIVGMSTINDGAIWHPFLYSGGAWTDLTTLGFVEVSHINNAGQFIGAGANYDALLGSRGGATVDLGPGDANGINDSGYVVGDSNGHAFLYADGEMRNLNDLIPSDSGWTLTSAYGINNNGQIVGVANATGVQHVLLLNPGPVPKKVQPNPEVPGGLVVTYQVFQQLPAGQTFPISVYWATGAKPDNALSVNSPHGAPAGTQAKDVGDALYTEYVDSSKGPGTHTFDVSPDKLVTAPNRARYLMIVADPKETFLGHSYPNAILADKAHIGELSPSQLQTLMPGLSAADARRYAPLLLSTMDKYGISSLTQDKGSLEREAMFFGQLAVESQMLQHWIEDPTDFITHYWVCPVNGNGRQNPGYGTKWGGLGASFPTADGLMLAVPAAKNDTADTKQLQLHWSNTAGPGFATETFTRDGNSFVYLWAGSNQEPRHTTQLLVVDPATHRALLTITNRLCEFQPQDASDFRGRGPIQLTGRYNYQTFADAVHRPDIMTDPQLLSDKVNHPEIGIEAAAWYFSTHGCNAASDSFAWKAADPFNLAISKAINGINPKTGKPNDWKDRLKNYIRIRIDLLDPNF
jgi:probable HAF family extracellular repeat protein